MPKGQINVWLLNPFDPRRKNPVLILCLPRSGSKYITWVLRLIGIAANHASAIGPGTDGFVDNAILSLEKGKSHLEPYINRDRCGDPARPEETKKNWPVILHQIREPLGAITGITELTSASRGPMRKNLLLPHDLHPVVEGMRMYLAFNKWAAKIAQWTYQIERLPKHFDEFCKRLGFSLGATKQKRRMLDTIPTNMGHRMRRHYTWEILEEADLQLSKEVRALAGSFGYGGKG